MPRLVLTAALALFAGSLQAQVTPPLPYVEGPITGPGEMWSYDDSRADAQAIEIPNPAARP